MMVVTAKFIKDNSDLINEGKWEELYQKDTGNFDLLGDLTISLMEAGIDPLLSLTYIPKKYLANSTIKEFNIPSNIKIIGEKAFNGCVELDVVHLPETIEFIGKSAFEESSITSIDLPESLFIIEDEAFAATMLKNVKIPNKVSIIPKFCFESSTLQSVTFGNGVKYIQDRAFGECSNLQFVDLNEGLLQIHDYAFVDCIKIDSVYIPSSVTRISDTAFYRCKKLVIQCEEESYAHQYAVSHRIEYQLV